MKFAMRVPMVVLRLVAVVPALLVSFVLTVVVCALLPPGLGFVLFLAAGGLLATLAAGRLEDPATRLLTGSRPATEAESAVMAPVVTDLASRGVAGAVLYVRRTQRPTTPVALAVGGRVVVVTPGLVEATYHGAVAVAETSAAIAHAIGRRRVIRPRLELAVLAATVPWRTVLAVCRGVGRAFAWLPLMQVAWTLRGVVGVVCVVQSAVEGRAAAGLLGGAVIALTYLVPAAGRGIDTRAELGADQLVFGLGLGPTLAGLLRRFGHPMSLERRQRLEVAPAAPPAAVQEAPQGASQRPRLHLVRD